MLDMTTSLVLILAVEDDPMCPLPVVEDLASQLPADTTRLMRLPTLGTTSSATGPDLAFPAIEDFIRRVKDSALSKHSGLPARPLLSYI